MAIGTPRVSDTGGLRIADQWGFLWYPVDHITALEVEFENPGKIGRSGIYSFADYLSKCWSYGVRIQENGAYEMGLVPMSDQFIPITDSLARFIQFYVADSKELYPP